VTALADEAWIANTRAGLAGAAARLDQLLAGSGLVVLGGTPLFRLIVHPDAEGLYEALASRGILTRRFAAYPRWLRLGLPGSEAEWARLAANLADVQQDRPEKVAPPPEPAGRS
jgi:cobalamin biosynthetic protein CobC